MFTKYLEWSNGVLDESKGKDNAGIAAFLMMVLTFAVFILLLPYFLVSLTIFKPKTSAIVWFALGVALFGFVYPSLPLMFVYTLILGVAGYLSWRYLAGWRMRLIVRNDIRDYLKEFYDGSDSKVGIKVLKTAVPGSYRVDFRTPRGKTDEQLMKQLEGLGSALALVRYMPLDLDERQGFVSILISFTDPLLEHLDSSKAQVLNLTDEELDDPGLWLEVGIYADTEPMEVPWWLPELGAVRNMTAGASGTGKSSIQKQRLLFACLSPHFEVALCDGKGTEFDLFKPYSDFYAFGGSSSEFFAWIRFLEQKVLEHKEILNASKASGVPRKYEVFNPYDDGKIVVAVWDEIGATMGGLDTKQYMEAENRLFAITSIARSLGIATNFSSQTFNSAVISTRIRDNTFDAAEGFKLANFQESKFIGFTEDDEARPDKIRGNLLKSGRTSSAGQVVLRGFGRNTYGKSYFITSEQIRSTLEEKGVRKDDKTRLQSESEVLG